MVWKYQYRRQYCDLEHCSIISTTSVQRETFIIVIIIPSMAVDVQPNPIMFFSFPLAVKIIDGSHCKISLDLAFNLSPEGLNGKRNDHLQCHFLSL